MALLSEAAQYDLTTDTFDVQSAFLIPEMKPDSTPHYGKIDATMVPHVIALFPELKIFVAKNGCMYFRLKKYMYGTEEAAKRFYDHVWENLFN